MVRHLRWLIFAPAAVLALTTPAQANPVPGLNAVGYTYQPTGFPLRVDDLYPTCGSEVENNINRNFNGEPFQDCGWDFFMVHYTGYITIPENVTVQMMVAADDGGTIKIGQTEFGTWNLKGCSWSQPASITESGSLPLDGWFFEWGGGACYMLAWRINNGPWEIVPDSAFTRQPLTPPTTTTTTTEPPTTTTEPPTTTTTSTTTTTEPPTTTTTSTTTTTTVYIPPTTTTTTTEPPTTTTTSTVPETTTTLPPTTLPPPPTTVAPQPSSTTTIRTTVPPTTTVPETPTTPTPTTSQAPPPATQPETPSSPQVTLPTNPTPQQIAETIGAVTVEEAAEVFAELEIQDLDEAQVAALIVAVQNAPDEVREEFEDQIDIFKEGLDDYVPVGSNIPVGTRRTLVAVGAAITAVGASSRMRQK